MIREQSLNTVSLQVFWFITGLGLLVLGGSQVVKATEKLACMLKLPIGFVSSVILGFATSLPEISVSLLAAWNNAIELSLGNVLGSYMCNIGLVLGIGAIVRPISLTTAVLRFDLPFMVLALLLLTVTVLDGQFSSIDCIPLLVLFTLYLVFSWTFRRDDRPAPQVTQIDWRSWEGLKVWGMFLFSLVLLFFGSEWMVDSGKRLAEILGVPDIFIGLTMMAIGTSLPELATTLAAVLQGKSELAVGNILGSNIYCLLFIICIPILLSQSMVSTEILWSSLISMVLMTFVFWLFCAKFDHNQKLNRLEGMGLLAFYLLHLIELVFRGSHKVAMIVT